MFNNDLWKRCVMFRVLDPHRLCWIRMSPRHVKKMWSINIVLFNSQADWRPLKAMHLVQSFRSAPTLSKSDVTTPGYESLKYLYCFIQFPCWLTTSGRSNYILWRVLDSHQLCRIPMERLQVITFWSIGIVFRAEWRPSKAIDLVESLGPAPT